MKKRLIDTSIAALVALAALATVGCGTSSADGDPGGATDAVDTAMAMDGPVGEVVSTTCADFCALSLSVCTGEAAQFGSQDSCEALCATWPAGTAGTFEGNSLACRTTHLTEVADDPAANQMHCDHTGPGGGGTCGTECDEYCYRVIDACTGDHQVYATDAECQAACAGFADTGADGDLAGDTVQCRTAHAVLARQDPIHCAHAAVDSAVCK